MRKPVPLRKVTYDTWGEALEASLVWKRAAGLADRTLKDYRYHISRFFTKFPGSWMDPSLDENLYRYLGEKMAPVTFNIRKLYLKGFLTWLVDQGVMDHNPLTGLKTRHAEPRIVRIPADILQKLIHLPNPKTYAGLRDKALIMLQLDTGIRPGEALALLPADFNASATEIRIRPEVSKTGKARTLILSRTCTQAISRVLAVRPLEWEDAPIFCTEEGRPLRVAAWGNRLRDVYSKKLGFHITPYDLRHAHALMFLRNNGNVFALQREMGHSDLDMTKRYLALSEDDLREAHAMASPLNSLLGNAPRKRLRLIKDKGNR
jgi:integrase